MRFTIERDPLSLSFFLGAKHAVEADAARLIASPPLLLPFLRNAGWDVTRRKKEGAERSPLFATPKEEIGFGWRRKKRHCFFMFFSLAEKKERDLNDRVSLSLD